MELDVETARWLTSPAGLAAVTTATQQLDGGADELAVATRLRRLSAHAERRAAVLEAATARRRARGRWPAADELLFTRQSLEQASDPVVAAHRAGRLLAAVRDRWMTTDAVIDLCAGIGGDTIALAQAAADPDLRVVAVDTDAARLVLLAHNAAVAGVAIETRHADALTVDLPAGSVLHADPSRRRDGRRIRRLADHVPSVPALLAAHADAARWAVALAPGVDVEDPDLPDGIEVEYVQLGGALVEATVWLGVDDPSRSAGAAANAAPEGREAFDPGGASPSRSAGAAATAAPVGRAVPDAGGPSSDGARSTRATLLAGDGAVLTRSGVPAARVRLPVGDIGRVLIEVAPAAVRARLHDAIGRELGVRRVAQQRALLTGDVEPPASPWYRARPVLAVLSARPRSVRRWLQDHEPGTGAAATVELVLHGVTADPEQLWRDLGRPRRGPQGIRLEFIRRDDDSIAVVTDASGAS